MAAHSCDDPVLAADILAALAGNPAPEPLGAEQGARIKRRLLARIAQAEPGHLSVPAGGGDWQALRPGIEMKVLHEAGPAMSYLLRLAPGAVIPAHRHPLDEECVVLEGALRIGDTLVVEAGGFHLAHAGALHADISAPGGALIFLRGAAPHPADLV